MRYVILLLLIFTITANAKSVNRKLEVYRVNALWMIADHESKHPDCELNNLYQLIATIDIEWFKGDKYTSAYFYNGIIYLNSSYNRSKKDAAYTIVHEAYHAYGICGEDIFKSIFPICRLFGKPVYYSTDITELIKNHINDFK